MDSEGLLQCPYDKNHLIRPHRFPYHLVKCRENNRSIAQVLATCPFNARHRVPKKELELHMKSCENKSVVEPIPVMLKEETSSDRQSPPCTENWEDDYSSSPCKTFVLKEFGNYQPYSVQDTVQSPPRTTNWASHKNPRGDWKPEASDGHPSHSSSSGPRAPKQEKSGAAKAWQPRKGNRHHK